MPPISRKLLLRSVLAITLCLAIAEVTARFAFDFPLYAADDEVGYWPAPNQMGSFLFRNDWAFNSTSLGVAEEFRPSDKFDLLLVGDSIVYGGNGLRQGDKLGPAIEQATGWQVWPAAAGSWGLQNELAFLRRHPKLVAGADLIVFVANSGDFTTPSVWRSPYSHPREYPALFLSYLFARYVAHPGEDPPAPFPVPQRNVLADWTSFVETAGKPVLAVSYSSQAQAGQNCGWMPQSFKSVGAWICYDGKAVLGPSGFRDDIHPSVKGDHVLAQRIIEFVNSKRTG